jgi:DNA-binding response OmpR family regulator
VVEDDHALRDLYRSRLRGAGYAVVGVEDGLDALRVIEGATPSAVVLDLALPRLNGRAVLGELEANSSTRGIPVIVVTGTDASDIDSRQFTCILKKPIDAETLTAAVDKCVKGWRR